LSTNADAVTYPTITVDVAPAIYAEGATITPGDPTLATVVATPKKIAHLIQMSNEVIDDSDPSIIAVLTDHLLKNLALKLDQQLLEGSGAGGQFTGLHLMAGVQTMASAAIMANFDWASDALALLEAVGGKPAAWFMASRTRAQIRKLHETGTSVKPVMDPQGPAGTSPTTLFGVPIFHSPQVSVTDAPGTATAVHLVAEGAVIYVNRTSPVIEVDRSRLFNSDQSEMRAKLRGDLIAAIPNGVVRITGMLPG
jgi:HK97 family phage major capsid protein